MKTVAIGFAALLATLGTAAGAAYDRYGRYYEPRDYISSDFRGVARVIDSRPVYSGRGRHSRLEGYDVRYVYRGQEYVTRLSSDPGRRLVLGRDIRDDGSPYDPTRFSEGTFDCRTVDPISRPGWCDQEGQGG